MKKVSDANRFSIIHDMKYCYFCKRKPIEKHEIFGGYARRQLSKNYGLVIGLCKDHHDKAHSDHEFAEQLHIIGQQAFEKKYQDLDFLEVFGKNYL